MFGGFLFVLISSFLTLFDKLISNSVDNFGFVFSQDLDSLGKSNILFNGRVEFNGSSSVLKEDLVYSFRILVSSFWDWFDSVSVILEALIMIGVIF